MAPPDAIQELIDAHYAPDRAIERLLGSVGSSLASAVHVEAEAGPEQVATRDAESAPIMRLTSLILRDAVHARASDIHVEPEREGGRVRFRVDGVLQPYTRLSLPILNRVVSRMKILGKMDIADRLRPQDGRARIRGRSVDRSAPLDGTDAGIGEGRHPPARSAQRPAARGSVAGASRDRDAAGLARPP